MTITVAGNKKEYEDGINLPTLIEKEQIDNAEYVTVTINDELEFLYFMGGGAR